MNSSSGRDFKVACLTLLHSSRDLLIKSGLWRIETRYIKGAYIIAQSIISLLLLVLLFAMLRYSVGSFFIQNNGVDKDDQNLRSPDGDESRLYSYLVRTR